MKKTLLKLKIPIFTRGGFTLIELSIVLVIIGLIVGGVLTGQELIRAAELRSHASLVQKTDTMANTFRNKYNCLPGDCASAASFGLVGGCSSPAQANYGNGNGDGKLDSGYQYPEEDNTFFCHSYNAGLSKYSTAIGGSPVAGLDNHASRSFGATGTDPNAYCWTHPCKAVPTDVSSAYISVQGRYPGEPANDGPTNGFYFYIHQADPNNYMYAVFSPAELAGIDAKIDDGLPTSGKFRLSGGLRVIRCLIPIMDLMVRRVAPNASTPA